MQPKQRFKKTLLAGALILGAGNAFNASADLFPVTAGAVPDVTAGMVTGYTELSFGTGIIGNKVGDTCAMNGITDIADAALLWDAGADDADTAEGANYGLLVGSACITTDPGVPMVIEIDGADTSTVTITVADVVGAGYTYTPTAESCVIDFDRATGGGDSCVSLATNTVTGVGMSLTVGSDGAGSVEGAAGSAYEFAAISGKTRMVLAGQLTIDSAIPAGTVITDSIVVQVTYE